MINEKRMKERMVELETRNRLELSKPKGSYTRDEMLKQISPEIGPVISMIASLAPRGTYLELGTSAGYSTMWIVKGMSQENYPLITHELLDEKVKLALETFSICGFDEEVVLEKGDCRLKLPQYSDIGFCFLDCSDDLYTSIYEELWPRMLSGGILVADNILSTSVKQSGFLESVSYNRDYNYFEINVGKGISVFQKK